MTEIDRFFTNLRYGKESGVHVYTDLNGREHQITLKKEDMITPTEQLIEEILKDFDEKFVGTIQVPSDTTAVEYKSSGIWKEDPCGGYETMTQPYQVKEWLKQTLTTYKATIEKNERERLKKKAKQRLKYYIPDEYFWARFTESSPSYHELYGTKRELEWVINQLTKKDSQ